MRKSPIRFYAQIFMDWYPYVIALTFLGALYRLPIPDKGAFAARALVALVLATFLAHVNRIFYIVPAHLFFPSGHTTFCLGLALSLGMLRPWTLYATLPLAFIMACTLVRLHYHELIDVIGAVPLVILIYGGVHSCWRLPSDAPLLDEVRVST